MVLNLLLCLHNIHVVVYMYCVLLYQETISQLANENKHLRTVLDTHNDTVSERTDTASSKYNRLI